MRYVIKKLIVLVCLLTFMMTIFYTGAVAEAVQQQMMNPTPADTFIDALFYRPIGLALIPLGAALFVISLPFSAIGGNVPSAFHNLVVAPAEYTFCRPLGEI
ncbi:MAG: hypothetical protein AB1724_08070 [Thermodesulfobacteriota bacterium]